MGIKQESEKLPKTNQPKVTKSKNSQKNDLEPNSTEVLINLPGGLKYRMPGKRQRVVVSSIVVGLNALLVLVVVIYFNNPAFREFVFTVGRK